MELNIWSLYQSSHPNQFVLLGPDVMASGANGVRLQQFRINAGSLTFPLLRDCADGSALSDTNLIRPYNERDNYVVIDANGIIRYHADDFWDYGNRLHLAELHAAISGALNDIVSVPTTTSGALLLSASPNPSSGRFVFALSHHSAPARFRVLDLSGRLVAAFEGPAPGAGPGQVIWEARALDGRALPAGLYLVQVESGLERLTRRIVLTR